MTITDIFFCTLGIIVLVFEVLLAIRMEKDDREHAADYERHRLDHEYWMRMHAQEDSLWYDRPRPMGRATPCPNCLEQFPESVLKSAAGALLCARCSPQAKAASRGFYEVRISSVW